MMMEHVKTAVWYAVLLAVLMGLWHVGASYRVAIVEDGFTAMEPAIRSGALVLLDRRISTIRALARDDIIAFRLVQSTGETRRVFARVVAGPGKTVMLREGRLVVDGSDVTAAPGGLDSLTTGLVVPRDTVFVVFDSAGAEQLPLPMRLVPYRNIVGRKMGG